MAVKFNVKNVDENVVVVEFELESGVITPEELPEVIAELPKVEAGVGVVLSGRGPVWLFGAMVHEYHPTPFVACYDPRLGGGVVVESHTKEVKLGDVIPV